MSTLLPTGYFCIDNERGGLRPGELWIHGGYAGHLKSRFALNYAYQSSYIYQERALVFSFHDRASFDNKMLSIHSSHGKFVTRSHKGEQLKNPHIGFSLRQLENNSFQHPWELDILGDVRRDWDERKEFHPTLAPALQSNTIGEIHDTLSELIPKNYHYTVVIDGFDQIQGPRSDSWDIRDRNNQTAKELLRLAEKFNVPIMATSHVNRAGYIRVVKRGGEEYDLGAFDWDVEQHASLVTTSFSDDLLEKEGKFYLQCLRDRHGKKFRGNLLKCKREVSLKIREIQAYELKLDDNDVIAASEYVLAPDMIIT